MLWGAHGSVAECLYGPPSDKEVADLLLTHCSALTSLDLSSTCVVGAPRSFRPFCTRLVKASLAAGSAALTSAMCLAPLDNVIYCLTLSVPQQLYSTLRVLRFGSTRKQWERGVCCIC